MKKVIFLIFVACTFLSACSDKENFIKDAVYILEASEKESVVLTISEDGGQKSFAARVVEALPNDVNVHFEVQEDLLDGFNKKYGTNYQMLPEQLYSLSANTAEIKAGDVTSDLINVTINPLDESFDPSHKYAIPVAITNANGAEVLEGSDKLFILLNNLIHRKVPYWEVDRLFSAVTELNAAGKKVMSNPLAPTSEFTMEFLVRTSADFPRTTNIGGIYGTNLSAGKSNIYSRMSDGTSGRYMFQCTALGVQAVAQTAMAKNSWHHVAIVCDGVNFHLYIDGREEALVGNTDPGWLFSWDILAFGGNEFKGAAAEMRIWSVARKPNEIASNMYVVAPDSEHLELYLKLDDGEGNIFKDYSGHGRDFKTDAGKMPIWEDIVFPLEL